MKHAKFLVSHISQNFWGEVGGFGGGGGGGGGEASPLHPPVDETLAGLRRDAPLPPPSFLEREH